MTENKKTEYNTLIFNAEQLDFLRQTLNANGLSVPVKLAKVAGEVYAIVMAGANASVS